MPSLVLGRFAFEDLCLACLLMLTSRDQSPITQFVANFRLPAERLSEID
jgi:hypothetical protein